MKLGGRRPSESGTWSRSTCLRHRQPAAGVSSTSARKREVRIRNRRRDKTGEVRGMIDGPTGRRYDICWSSAAGSTAPGSRATRPGAASVLLVGAGRPGVGHVLGVDQADPWRAALSRILRVPAGARGAGGARGAVGVGAAHHLAAALRAAASRRAAAGLAAAARALRLRPSRAAGSILPATDARPAQRPGRASRCKPRVPPAASNIPTAGSTMRGWSCSTRATRAARGARSRTRTAVRRAARRDGDAGGSTLEDRGRRARDASRAGARQRRRAVGRARCRAASRQRPRPTGAAGQGQPHRRAEAVRPRPRLHLPERRRADRLRHPLRARLHADRHHRRRLRRRPGRGGDAPRRRSTICCAAASEYFAQAGHARATSSGPIPACGRCSTTAPRRRRRRRATMC